MKRRKNTITKIKKAIVISVVGFVVLFLLGLTGPMSDAKAIALAEQYCSQGLYCSGYHYDKSDNTCIAVFRNKKTDEIEKSITVSYEAAEKLYDEYGIDHE